METHSYSRVKQPLQTYDLIHAQLESYYQRESKNLPEGKVLEMVVPLADGTLLILGNVYYIAENLVWLQGTGKNGEEVNAFTSPFGLQFIFRVVDASSPKREVGFVDGKI